MKKIFSVIFLLLVLSSSIYAKNKWKELPLSTNVKKIIGGESVNDFWLLDRVNNIVHYTDTNKDVYRLNKVIKPTEMRGLVTSYFSMNNVFIAVISKDWKTNILSITNGKIMKYDISIDGPIGYFGFVAGNYYAFGDFGIIAKLENGKWKMMNSPIKNSFLAVGSVNSDKVFLNVRNSGIWSFDGEVFTHNVLPNDGVKLDYNLKVFHDSIFVLDYYGKVYNFQNDSFIQINKYKDKVFNSKRYINSNEIGAYSSEGKLITIPLLIKVDVIYHLKDNTILVLSQDGSIYYNSTVDNNYFSNYASSMGVEGLKYSSSLSNDNSSFYYKNEKVAIADINNDNLSDVLLFDGFSFIDKYIYINSNSGVFNNSTTQFGFNNYFFNGIIYSALDINNDNEVEIIASSSKIENEFFILKKHNKEYFKANSIETPKEYYNYHSVMNSYTDFDKDGDIDIVTTFGYSVKGAGSAVVYYNNGYGEFSIADTSLSYMLKGWNVSTLSADFNNDGFNDILLNKSWGHNKIFFQYELNKWREYKIDISDTNIYAHRKGDISVFDYDNDGDLDIFNIVNYQIVAYQNIGDGEFVNITTDLGLTIENGTYYICSADFNNDGFIDIYLYNSKVSSCSSILFLNDSSYHFTDHTAEMGLSGINMRTAAILDIDNDGDIDIYGIRGGYNALWVNNLDDNNYLKIKLHGFKSNTVGLGAKVWIYESGHIDNADFLKAYQQLGSKEFSVNSQDDLILHFGLDASGKYDIKVQFYGGELKKILNVSAGQTITVEENIGLLAFYYSIDNTLYQLLNNSVFLTYFVVISIGLLALFFSIYYGNKLFGWSVRLTSIIISLDIILFTSLLLALNDIDSIYRYIIPLGSAVLGSLGPLGVFIWIDKYNSLQSSDEVDYELFNALRNFSHGEWAASNLNSLQLLFENLSLEDINDEDYILPFNNRKTTFLELTKPLIEDIITLSSKLAVSKDSSESIKVELEIITKCIRKDINNSTLDNKEQIAKSIIKLRENISLLRKLIFRNHSCSPFKVYKNISENIVQLTKEANVKLVFKSFMSEKDMALMDAASLADIIDNCVNNSLKAMTEVSNKVLTIKLINDDLRYFVSISDNGCGVDEQDQDIIFDNGYSTNASTGFGLYYAKDTLSKYGARIYVNNSEPWILTTFIIELQKNNNR